MDLKWVKGYDGGTSYEWPGYHVGAGGYRLKITTLGRGCWHVYLAREANAAEVEAGSYYLVGVSKADATTAAAAKQVGHDLLMTELAAQGLRLEKTYGGWIRHRLPAVRG